jgi:hypothetical protein
MDAGSYLNNGKTPPTYSAHERFYLGWLTPEILNQEGDYTLEALQRATRHISLPRQANIISMVAIQIRQHIIYSRIVRKQDGISICHGMV